MTVDQLAMAVAGLVTSTHGGDGEISTTGGKRPDGPCSVAKVAEDYGVTKTALKAAKVVLNHGSDAEIAATKSGAKRAVRQTADPVRASAAMLSPCLPRPPCLPATLPAPAALLKPESAAEAVRRSDRRRGLRHHFKMRGRQIADGRQDHLDRQSRKDLG